MSKVFVICRDVAAWYVVHIVQKVQFSSAEVDMDSATNTWPDRTRCSMFTKVDSSSSRRRKRKIVPLEDLRVRKGEDLQTQSNADVQEMIV